MKYKYGIVAIKAGITYATFIGIVKPNEFIFEKLDAAGVFQLSPTIDLYLIKTEDLELDARDAKWEFCEPLGHFDIKFVDAD